MIVTEKELRRMIHDYTWLCNMWRGNAKSAPTPLLRAEYQERADEYARLVGIAKCELAGLRDAQAEGK